MDTVPVTTISDVCGARRSARLAGGGGGRTWGSDWTVYSDENDCDDDSDSDSGLGGRGGAARGARRGAGSVLGSFASLRGAVTSRFKGVSRHSLTGRWESSLWLKGRQVYLGGFSTEEGAARAYDVAALVLRSGRVATNFPSEQHAEAVQQLSGLPHELVVAEIRRRSSAFARGKSKFRGVSGGDRRWEARVGCFLGWKNTSFGAFSSEEEAARLYDRALLVTRGPTAMTNFALSEYQAEVAAYKRALMATYGVDTGPRIAPLATTLALPYDINVIDSSRSAPTPRTGGVSADEMRGEPASASGLGPCMDAAHPRAAALRRGDELDELCAGLAKKGRATVLLAEQLRRALERGAPK
ncbi:unnamed protein product [Pedinophyceae sp. YPF-701]|nr:unnamed protein product [Pedinophyceae sp. YPF-701]